MRRGVLAAIAAMVIAIAGCGSSQTGAAPSGLDPARVAPASTLVYLELAPRPQGGLQAAAETALTKMLGKSPDSGIQQLVDKLLSRIGMSYASDLRPWLGQRVAFIATSLTPAGVALIAPTNDPSAATSFFDRILAKLGAQTSKSRYHGVAFELADVHGTSIAAGAIGGYAVVGGVHAFDQIIDARNGGGLADRPQFETAMAALPANDLLRAYARWKPLLQQYLSLLRVSSSIQALNRLDPGLMTRSAAQLKRLSSSATETAALSLSPSQIEGELARTGFPNPRASANELPDVTRLPASTWLGLSVRSFGAMSGSPGWIQEFRTGLKIGLSSNPGGAVLLNTLQSRLGFSLNDLLAALGPFDVAVSGDSVPSLSAGLIVRPFDPHAAAIVLSSLRRRLSSQPGFQASSPGYTFSIDDPRLAHKFLVLDLERDFEFGFSPTVANPSAHPNPSVMLESDPAFRQARATLPTGSSVALYVAAAPIARLVQSSPKAQSATDQKVIATLQRFTYLIAGGANGIDRFVLGLR